MCVDEPEMSIRGPREERVVVNSQEDDDLQHDDDDGGESDDDPRDDSFVKRRSHSSPRSTTLPHAAGVQRPSSTAGSPSLLFPSSSPSADDIEESLFRYLCHLSRLRHSTIAGSEEDDHHQITHEGHRTGAVQDNASTLRLGDAVVVVDQSAVMPLWDIPAVLREMCETALQNISSSGARAVPWATALAAMTGTMAGPNACWLGPPSAPTPSGNIPPQLPAARESVGLGCRGYVLLQCIHPRRADRAPVVVILVPRSDDDNASASVTQAAGSGDTSVSLCVVARRGVNALVTRGRRCRWAPWLWQMQRRHAKSCATAFRGGSVTDVVGVSGASVGPSSAVAPPPPPTPARGGGGGRDQAFSWRAHAAASSSYPHLLLRLGTAPSSRRLVDPYGLLTAAGGQETSCHHPKERAEEKEAGGDNDDECVGLCSTLPCRVLEPRPHPTAAGSFFYVVQVIGDIAPDDSERTVADDPSARPCFAAHAWELISEERFTTDPTTTDTTLPRRGIGELSSFRSTKDSTHSAPPTGRRPVWFRPPSGTVIDAIRQRAFFIASSTASSPHEQQGILCQRSSSFGAAVFVDWLAYQSADLLLQDATNEASNERTTVGDKRPHKRNRNVVGHDKRRHDDDPPRHSINPGDSDDVRGMMSTVVHRANLVLQRYLRDRRRFAAGGVASRRSADGSGATHFRAVSDGEGVDFD